MGCCKSMLARRIVLWYIILGTFVIFPLSFNVGLGCRFLNVSVDTNFGFQSFGPFNVAIYDPDARMSKQFLGCVDLSLYWEEQTSDDFGFLTLRIASAFMLGFVSLATFICICIQCFSKHGKTHWWRLMRFCYCGATMSQGAMYTVFFSDICLTKADDDESNIPISSATSQCTPGTTGIIGVFNFALLFGMVITTFISLPPRNPVFQCWDGDMEYTDESEDGSTSEEDSVIRKFKAMGETDNDSVSLFGGSRMSRKSRRSTKSKVSGKDGDESASAAEKGLSVVSVKSEEVQHTPTISEEGSAASIKSGKSNQKGKSNEIIVETVESESVSTAKSTRSKKSTILPVVSKLFSKSQAVDENKSIASDKKSSVSVPIEKSSEEESKSYKKSVEEIASLSSKKSNRSLKSMSSKRSNKSLKSSDSKVMLLKRDSQEVKSAGSLSDYGLKSTMSSASGSTLEVTNFVIQLIEMTELEEGGRRVKLADNENQVEIIDEYPIEEGGEIKSTSSSDEIAVRTEYYDLGSRSTKEIRHKDGSRTIITTITVDVSSDSTTATSKKATAPLEPQIELSRSAGSIESIQSSKYQVMKSDSSATSYTGTRKNRNQVKQGDLCLSVATPSLAK